MMELPEDLEVQIDPSKVNVTEDGKKVMRPDVLQTLINFAQLAQLNRIRKQAERQKFEGKTDSRTLDATDKLQVLNLIYGNPYVPWINVFVINYGADTCYVAINNINKPNCWHEIKVDETRTFNQSGAEERIGLFFYKCDGGETATLHVEAHY